MESDGEAKVWELEPRKSSLRLAAWRIFWFALNCLLLFQPLRLKRRMRSALKKAEFSESQLELLKSIGRTNERDFMALKDPPTLKQRISKAEFASFKEPQPIWGQFVDEIIFEWRCVCYITPSVLFIVLLLGLQRLIFPGLFYSVPVLDSVAKHGVYLVEPVFFSVIFPLVTKRRFGPPWSQRSDVDSLRELGRQASSRWIYLSQLEDSNLDWFMCSILGFPMSTFTWAWVSSALFLYTRTSSPEGTTSISVTGMDLKTLADITRNIFLAMPAVSFAFFVAHSCLSDDMEGREAEPDVSLRV